MGDVEVGMKAKVALLLGGNLRAAARSHAGVGSGGWLKFLFRLTEQ